MNYRNHVLLRVRLRVTPVRFYNLHSDARQFKSHRPMNLQRANLNRLDVQRRDLRDLKGRGPWAVASERSTSNLYVFMYTDGQILCTHIACTNHLLRSVHVN